MIDINNFIHEQVNQEKEINKSASEKNNKIISQLDSVYVFIGVNLDIKYIFTSIYEYILHYYKLIRTNKKFKNE